MRIFEVMRKLFYLLFLMLVWSCTVCKEPTEDYGPVPQIIQVKINARAVLEEPLFIDSKSYIKISAFRFYISNISYRIGQADFVMVRDAFLYDAEEQNDTMQLAIPSNATAIKFGIGVPPGINTGDPTLWPNIHPYSIKGSHGMHWNWNTGYRFVVCEGKRDTIESGSFNQPFSFHTGTDSLYRELVYSLTPPIKSITIQTGISSLFTDIDLQIENETHTVGNPDLARRFTDNFCRAIYVSTGN